MVRIVSEQRGQVIPVLMRLADLLSECLSTRSIDHIHNRVSAAPPADVRATDVMHCVRAEVDQLSRADAGRGDDPIVQQLVAMTAEMRAVRAGLSPRSSGGRPWRAVGGPKDFDLLFGQFPLSRYEWGVSSWDRDAPQGVGICHRAANVYIVYKEGIMDVSDAPKLFRRLFVRNAAGKWAAKRWHEGGNWGLYLQAEALAGSCTLWVRDL
jgi:hypothetical protein